jgi:predicted nucleic acid-binding protein
LTEKLKDERVTIVTSSFVLVEVLASFAATPLRVAAADFVAALRLRVDLLYFYCGETHFEKALQRYRQYRDKEWSLTDCSSMVIMNELGIYRALTHDHHFEQAGFVALFRH